MIKKILFIVLILAITQPGIAQDKPDYILYNSRGKKVSYKKMIRMLKEKDIVLIGEFHNNPISHWMELEITRDLKESRELVLGAEMFEADNQEAVDKYLAGQLSPKGLDSNARLWKNYSTNYAPLINFAKENHLRFAATNIPRRYASLVAKGGFEKLDSLPLPEKNWIAPLPIDYDPALPGYKKMLEMMPGHTGANLPKAQAIKDATMAYFILQYYNPGNLFIHYNGAYHLENYEGILWYLKRKRPDLHYATVTTVSQKEIHTLLPENRGRADFIICVDEDMTTTY
jgi:uncharacterized iron-regulated protein